MHTRRNFLKTATAGLVTAGALPWLPQSLASGAAPAAASPTPRFVFIRKSNGTWPEWLVPPALSGIDRDKDKAKKPVDVPLSKLDLPDWMAPINDHKANITILQGLSAKMCTMGHATYQSPLAVCKAAENASTITRASVDVELGRMFQSPMEHIELTCAKNQTGVVTGMSSIGPGQPNFAFASPAAAYKNLFAAGSDDKDAQLEQSLDGGLYQFLSSEIRPKGSNLGLIEGEQKIGTYNQAVEDMIRRTKKLQSMSAQIRKFAPTLPANVMEDHYNTLEQQEAYGKLAASIFCAGLSNVITLTFDDLGTIYSGLYEFDVNLHEVGHGKETKGVDALAVRVNLKTHHMMVVNQLIQVLKKTPEGKGTMFDNTVIMYLPENGEKHHSIGSEVPFLIVAGSNFKLNTSGRYIRLPNYNEPGHCTLGNFYTTLLNAYGNPIPHYGDFDVALKINQAGAIKQLMS